MTYLTRLTVLLILSPLVAAFAWTRDDLSWWWLLIYWVEAVVIIVVLTFWMMVCDRARAAVRERWEVRRLGRE